MLRSAQIIFLVDISAPLDNYVEKERIDSYENSIKLSCLRLLTEIGALCERGTEGLRWAFKFYDSLRFKPGTTQKSFLDYNFESFEKFEEELIGKHSAKRKSQENAETSPNSRDHSHAYILNKAIQEILLDYDWDRPDISSPVKCVRRSNGDARVTRSTVIDTFETCPLNIVVSFADFPKNVEGIIKFEKSDGKKTNDLLNILDKSTQLGLKDKSIRLHLINCGKISIEHEFYKKCNTSLLSINGSLQELSTLVSVVPSKLFNNIEKSGNGNLFCKDRVYSNYNYTTFGISSQFWKQKQKPVSRNRVSQNGPTLLWDDENGISFIKLQLQVLSIKGSSTQQWDTLTVSSVLKADSMCLLGLAMPNSNLFICHSPKDERFKVILDILHSQQLVLILRHKCGGLAALSPWVGGAAYLAIFSASGFATPPIHINDNLVKANGMDETHSKVISNLIKKTLKVIPAMPATISTPESHQFCQHHLKPWYVTSSANSSEMKLSSSKFGDRRKQMMERLQKKYRPQIPQALSGSSMPPQVLVDVTQPRLAAAIHECGRNIRSRVETRGQQIAKRGQLLKAQKKALQLETEALELEEANRKKVETAEKRSRMLTTLTAKVMTAIGNSTKSEVLLSNLKEMRDQTNYCRDIDIDECDHLLVVVQALVSVALSVVKSNCPEFLVNSQLKETLCDGVFLTAAEVNRSYEGKDQVRQLKLQVLLHLEALWLSGYADTFSQDSHACKEKDYHVTEIVKHLRGISLHHDTGLMSAFLQKVLLPNYENTMGEILAEIYDELNQPLAASLECYSQQEPSPEPISSPHPAAMSKKQAQSAPPAKSPRKTRARMPIRRQTSHRQIVIKLPRRSSKRASTDDNPSNKLKNVKRNLFDSDPISPKVSVEATIKSLLKTPVKSGSNSLLPLINTPNSKSKSAKRSLLLSPCDLTPTKSGQESASKRRRTFVPETPAKQTGRTVFNSNRLCKSTGETTVGESPDVKRSHRLVGNENDYRSYALRKSFYSSNGCSRNFERGKRKVLASHISGAVNRRASMPAKGLAVPKHIFSNFMESMVKDTNNDLTLPKSNKKKLTFS